MRAYILRRLLISIPLVFLMTFVIFAVINTNPQSALEPYMLNENISFQVIEQVKERTGFYDAMPVRYAKWLSGVLFDIRFGRVRRPLVSFADPRQFSEQFAAASLATVVAEAGELHPQQRLLALADEPSVARRLAALRPAIASLQVNFETLKLPDDADPDVPPTVALTLRLQAAATNRTFRTTVQAVGPGVLRVTALELEEAGLTGRDWERCDLELEGDAALAVRSVEAGLNLFSVAQPERLRPFLKIDFPAADTAVTLGRLGSPHLTHRLERSIWNPLNRVVGQTDEGDPMRSRESFRRLILEVGNPTERAATYEMRLVGGPPAQPTAVTRRFALAPMQRTQTGFALAELAADGLDLAQVREMTLAAVGPSRLTVYRIELEMDGPPVSAGGIPDFGRSHDNIPVIDKLAGRIRNTVALVVCAMLITWLVALPAGVIAAVRQYGMSDRVLSFLTFVGMSLPSFFLAVLVRTLLQEAANPDSFFSFLPDLPNSGRTSIDYESLSRGRQIVDLVRHAVAPTLVLALGGMAGMQRVMRGTMLEAQRQQYIMTARAKGLSERAVICKHALRNAITPFVAGFGSILPGLIGGSLFIEMVFNYPGVGQMMYPAVLNRDLNLVMANTLIAALLLVFGNLLADILLAVVDPRVSYD
jgi:peptide/nickel transport system permease protein